MAKSLRSKSKQRYRRAKRHYIERTLHSDRINELHRRVVKLQQGLAIEAPRPKNAFLHPNDPEAIFPRVELRNAIDFRSEALPLAGYAVTGCRRHFTEQEMLGLDLIVRCKDGLLTCEREAEDNIAALGGLTPAEFPVEIVEGQNGNAGVAAVSIAAEVELLAAEMDSKMHMGRVDQPLVGSTLESASGTAIATAENDEALRKHQDRVGGRNKKSVSFLVPKLQNHLKDTTTQPRGGGAR